MLPRRAWELWLDGEVIHDDFAKQSEWESLGPADRAGSTDGLRLLTHALDPGRFP